MGVWGAEPPNGGMAAIPNSEVISITPELLFPHLGAGEKSEVDNKIRKSSIWEISVQ